MKFCFESEAWHEIFSGRDDGIDDDDYCEYDVDDRFCDGDDDGDDDDGIDIDDYCEYDADDCFCDGDDDDAGDDDDDDNDDDDDL